MGLGTPKLRWASNRNKDRVRQGGRRDTEGREREEDRGREPMAMDPEVLPGSCECMLVM